MTRIKVASVLAVAFVLTAFGASSAFAWQATISATADCHTVTVTAHDTDNSFRDHPTGDLVFVSTKGKTVTESYSFDTKNADKVQVIATVPATDLGVGSWVVVLKADDTVKTSFTIPSCPTPTPTATPHPTATAVPTETPSPTETASPAPTETASPAPTETASPTASAQPTSTSLPSPPVTGAGSGGSGSGSFAIVLLVMVLGTVVIGGTTLVLTRKGA